MTDQPSQSSLRVATMNIWGRHGVWAERRRVLQEGFRELCPDVVGFQEVHCEHGYDEAADVLGSDYTIVHQQLGLLGDGNMIAIGSRWRIGEVHELDLMVTPRTYDFPCTTLIAEILAPEPIGPFWFVNHIPSWKLNLEYERELQTAMAARAIEALMEKQPRHLILAGDLDADPNAASIRFWCGRQSLGGMSVCYRDTWESTHPDEPGHTFTPENPSMGKQAPDWPFRRIDYIFVRCDGEGPTLEIAACQRIFDRPVDGVYGSDHYGVMADLVVRR